MSVSRTRFRLAAALACAALWGCSQSLVEQHWSEAYRQDLARMVENPDAERTNLESPQGLDPSTGEKVIEKYQKQQGEIKKTQTAPSLIQVSTGGKNR